MADTKILREYLISLGFKTDTPSLNKFENTVNKAHLSVGALAKGVLGVATAAQTMVAVFATQMTNLYYASRKAEASVENLQAVRFASEQIGISADTTTAAVQGLASTLRNQPGMRGYLDGLIGDSSKLDNVERFIKLVNYLKTLPTFMGNQIGSLFGINPDDLVLFKEGNDELARTYALRKQMNTAAGLDVNEAAKAAREYTKAIGEMTAKAGVLVDKLSITLLPAFKGFINVVNQSLEGWADIVDRIRGRDSKKGGSLKQNGATTVNSLIRLGGSPNGANTVNSLARPRAAFNMGALAAELDAKYGFPPGTMARLINQESGGNPNAVSGAGAVGLTQLMPKTAKELGVTDSNDPEQNMRGGAAYLAKMRSMFGGNMWEAFGAYNAGPGTWASYKAGGEIKRETQDYVKKLAGVDIPLKVDIHVHGVQDPAKVAEIVAQKQADLTTDTIRNLMSPFQ